MDVVWLILDSLSYAATPFADDGPETMPQFESLAREQGVVFTDAWVPGPLSPSSHGSFFTGELPSTTGMHEAYPYLTRGTPTIATPMGETHRTHLVSANPWLYNGIDEEFDTAAAEFISQYLVFESATDPRSYLRKKKSEDDRGPIDFLFAEGKPIRSLVNGASYMLGHKIRTSDFPLFDSIRDIDHRQYAEDITNQVRESVDEPQESFVIANYMDVHPPFDVSDKALEQFLPGVPRSEIPANENHQRTVSNEEKSYDVDVMTRLYQAAIWDIDRILTPLVEDLLADDTYVVVTADHGEFFSTLPHEEKRLHVPLVIFAPDENPREVDHTVSIRSLPTTTMAAVGRDDHPFKGIPLLEVEADQRAITEMIYEDMPGRIDIKIDSSPTLPEELVHDLVLVEGDSLVALLGDETERHGGNKQRLEDLERAGIEIRETANIYEADTEAELDEYTKDQLRELGYL